MKILDALVFECSGKKLAANRGIIGINQSLQVTEGYDGDCGFNELMPVERYELAEYMIGLWTKYRDAK